MQAYDYHGEPQTTGKDPISVHFKDPNGREVSSVLVDNGDGSYEITLCPVSAGPHTLAVNILSRPIRGSPYTINVRGRQKPQWSIVDGELLCIPSSWEHVKILYMVNLSLFEVVFERVYGKSLESNFLHSLPWLF